MADEMSLAEAVNICKRLQGEYRAFERAAEAAAVVQRAHTEVQSFQRNAQKAKADLDSLEKQVEQAKETKKAADSAAAEAEKERKKLQGELDALQKELAKFRPHYEREKERVVRDIEGLRAQMKQELEQQRLEKLAAIEADVEELSKRQASLQTAVADLSGQRDALKARVEQAQQTLQ